MKFINILKKYKQLFIGILIGSFITLIPVSAAIKEYILYESECTLINSDGTKYEDKDYPLLMYKGSNYAPVGKIAQFLGIPFTWEGKTKTATFNTTIAVNKSLNTTETTVKGGDNVSATKTTSSTNPSLTYDEETGLPIGAEYVEYNGCKSAVKYNGNIYMSRPDLFIYLNVKFKTIDPKSKTTTYVKDDSFITIDVDDKTKYFINEQGTPFLNVNLFQ